MEIVRGGLGLRVVYLCGFGLLFGFYYLGGLLGFEDFGI